MQTTRGAGLGIARHPDHEPTPDTPLAGALGLREGPDAAGGERGASELRALTNRYGRGQAGLTAVDDVKLTVVPGQVFGFLNVERLSNAG